MSASRITFYSNPQSRAAVIHWMLEELGEPYDTVYLNYQGAMKTPEYLAINPMGKVPAIMHDGQVVTEGAAICAFLADQYPQKNLAPAIDSPSRGAYYRWLFFAAGPLEEAITMNPWVCPFRRTKARCWVLAHWSARSMCWSRLCPAPPGFAASSSLLPMCTWVRQSGFICSSVHLNHALHLRPTWTASRNGLPISAAPK